MACEIIKRNSKETAIHIKENFDIKNLVDFIYEYNIEKKCFIFSTLQDYAQLEKFENIKGWKIAYSMELGYFEVDNEVQNALGSKTLLNRSKFPCFFAT